MGTDRPAIHVGDRDGLPDAAWTSLPAGTTRIALSELAERDAPFKKDAVVVVRLDAGATDAAERLRRVRERFPDAPALAYSADDDPDAAIDANRLGIEYVSGRRLRADGETLADRVRERARNGDGGRGPEPDAGAESVLEPFIRIVSDRTTDLDEKLDALLELGRDRLGLSIGYSSRVDGDRLEIRQYSDGTGMLDSFIGSGPDADRSLPLELTYCKRTVRGDGVVAFTDPEAAGLGDDPAYERFGLGSYVGGSVVVGDEVYGSLCFLDPERRDRPFDESERLFVELLADWLGRAFERRAAREEREGAVERLEDTLERIDDAFFALDDDWRFTYVNEKAAALLDRPAGELVGANVWEEFPDAIGETYETSYRRAMETQESVSFVERYEPLDLWTEVTAYPSPDGLSVFFSDITDRKRRERILERLLVTVERIQRTDHKETIADRLIEAADDVLGYEIGGVRLYDPETDRLRLVATSEGLGERFAGRSPRPPGEGVTGAVYERGEPWVCDDVAALGDDRDYHGMRSFATMPLGEHGAFVVGAVEPDAFDEDDVSVLELLSTNAVAAMDAHDRRRRLRTYENALKNVDDMVCVLDADGAVTYATEPFAAWLGVDDRELVGSRLEEALPDPSADRVSTAVRGLLDRVASGGPAADGSDAEPVQSVVVSVERDDDSRTQRGELRLSALAGESTGVVGSLSDTTDLHRTRTELTREQDRFDRLFERLPDPVIEVALEPNETVIAGVNSAFAERFGYDPAALRGRTTAALDIHDDRIAGLGEESGTGGEGDGAGGEGDGAGDRSLEARVREAGSVTAEVRRRTVDGPREFLFRGFTYETAGGRRAFAIYTDITDRRRRERYFRVVNRILRHNLRNELNVVFGFASEIASNAEDDRTADYARRIETTGRRLADLADGAAGIRRVVEEGTVSDPEPVSVGRVAAAVREEYAERYPEARIDAAVPDDAVVRGDDRLTDALGHLVENAVVHARDDAPRVEIGAERHPEADTVSVRVADDGPGIPDGVRGVITGETEVTQLTHNTGIGLWIVAWIVEAYGGEVGVGPGIGG